MHRTKAFLVIPAMMVMVVTSFSSFAFGARPYEMDKWKGYVFIDGGENEGFVLGATVCFLSCSGKGLICGPVLKASPTEAMVKVDNNATKMRDICGEAILYAGGEDGEGPEEQIEVPGEDAGKKEKEPTNDKDWFQ